MSEKKLTRAQRFQKLQKETSDFYEEKSTALVALARKLGATDTSIAHALGIDPARLIKQYGKRGDFK